MIFEYKDKAGKLLCRWFVAMRGDEEKYDSMVMKTLSKKSFYKGFLWKNRSLPIYIFLF